MVFSWKSSTIFSFVNFVSVKWTINYHFFKLTVLQVLKLCRFEIKREINIFDYCTLVFMNFEFPILICDWSVKVLTNVTLQIKTLFSPNSLCSWNFWCSTNFICKEELLDFGHEAFSQPKQSWTKNVQPEFYLAWRKQKQKQKHLCLTKASLDFTKPLHFLSLSLNNFIRILSLLCDLNFKEI